MNILVVEDDAMVLKALEFRLKKDGYQVTTAGNGKEALEMLRTHSFDLVVTDLMLPFVTGLEVLSYVKATNPKLPVAILSGADDEANIMDAFRMGVDDFISKPFSPGELSLRVKRLLIRNA